MKKRILILSLLLVLILSFSTYASENWHTSSSVDKMEGTETWYAFSPVINPTKQMGFPYGDMEAWMGVAYDGEDQSVYISFSNSPNLNNTETKDGYSVINTRVRYDDKIKEATLLQNWGSKVLFFPNNELVISEIQKSNSLLLELNWYGEGLVYFEFPLKGSSDAIKDIYEAFEDSNAEEIKED